MSVQAVIVLVGALALMVSTVLLVRTRMLSVRYGLGWLTVSLLGVIVAPLLGTITTQARHLGFSATGFSLGILIAFLGMICLQLSISLSGHHRAIQDLSEYSALVEHRLRELESAHGAPPAPARTEAETSEIGGRR